jgi:NADPH:quinone reductase-like Zn-dependent oxidoreductase/malonyl CoA-acyl carrier protein transacylase
VISGERSAVAAVAEDLRRQGFEVRALATSHAFHSASMDPMLDSYERLARSVQYRTARAPIISNLTAKEAGDDLLADPHYWRRHIREPVRFADSIAHIGIRSGDVLLEIGPGPTLISLARQCGDEPGVRWLPSLRNGKDDAEQILESLGALYAAGVDPAWDSFHRDRPKRRIAFTTYPFQRERHWIERPAARLRRGGADVPAPQSRDRLIARRMSSPALTDQVFESEVSCETLPYVADHRIADAVVFPATGFLELALEAAAALGVESASVASLSIDRALLCSDRELIVQTIVAAEGHGRRPFRIFAKPAAADDQWMLHAAGELELAPGGGQPVAVAANLEEARLRCRERSTGGDYYARLRAKGFGYGPTFQGIRSISWCDGEAVAELGVPAAVGSLGRYCVHPAVLDAGLQAVLAAAGQLDADHLLVPSSFERVTVFGGLADLAWAHVRLRAEAASRSADVDIIDTRGRVVVAVRGVRIVRASAEAFESRQDVRTGPSYELKWKRNPLPAFRAPGSDAAFLPSPATLERRLGMTLDAVRDRHDLAAYDKLLPELDGLCAQYAANALVALGWTLAPGEQLSTDDLSRRLGVLPKYARMLARCLDMLAEDGFVERMPSGWRAVRPLEVGNLSADAERLRRNYPSCAVELGLTDRCGVQLAAVLCGRVDPLHLLFPGGSTSDLEQLYRDAPFTRAYNTVVRDAVSIALEAMPPERKLRVLEIGAGTGGTSSLVLPVLPADRTEYVFSDASNLFMLRAKARFADFPFVTYQLLDIEQDPAAQGYQPRDFDLVLATNVLHATPDARRTLRYVRELLAPQGMLVMVEGVSRQRWVDMIFGLTDGWWKATDADRADGYPLMSRAHWRKALTTAGFESPLSVPAEGRMPIFEQAVIIARAPAAASSAGPLAEAYAIVGDAAGFAGAVRARFEARGAGARIVAGAAVESAVAQWLGDGSAAAADREPSSASRRTLIYCVGADLPPEITSLGGLRAEAERQGKALLHVVQAMARTSGTPPRLCIVTRAAQSIDGANAAVNAIGATLWGMANVVALEHPELACKRIDVGPDETAIAAAERVAVELLANDREEQVSWRDDRRYVARLAPLRIERSATASEAMPVALRLTERGELDRLAVAPATRRAPGRGEIEIRVRAAGLNFKDVLNALGTYPGEPGPLGLECAGTVSAVGEGVDDFAVGDEVIAIAPGCFGTFAVTPAALAAPAPAGFTSEAAGSSPAAFVTAYHALHELACVKGSDRVLIHAAAGGVGMAAMQIALRAGAEVFATAGTPEKRALVRRMGAAHVFDSRTADFPEHIAKITQGKGVDVVLNSLAGQFIDRSFAVLSVGGRFIELGKNGIWEPSRVAALNRDIAYHIVDVQMLAAADAERVGTTLKTITSLIAAGELRPLPARSFPLSEARDAFRFVAQAKHVGKVVLRIGDRASDVVRSDASYLITGGFGGLGLLFAEWLASRGARHIALMGRREPDRTASAAITVLRERGVAITSIVGDVANFEDVDRALSTIRATMPALRGVLHAAGTLDDGALSQQRWGRFEHVMQAKVYGAWNLDRLTQGAALDWFVMFSSLAAMLGSRGQANHAAANAFMDALAHQRRARGLPALSINWGAWSRLGAAAADVVLKRLANIGIGALSPEEGVAIFDQLLSQAGSIPPQVGVLPVDWSRYVREACRGHVPPLLSELDAVRFETQTPARAPVARTSAVEDEAAPLTKRLAGVRPRERHDMLIGYLRDHVVSSLGLNPQRALDLKQPLSELGLDSLMAVELRTRIARGLGTARSLPATLLFDYPTIADLADYLRRELFPDAPAVPAIAPRDAAHRDAVAGLSEEEAEARLLEELSGRASI